METKSYHNHPGFVALCESLPTLVSGFSLNSLLSCLSLMELFQLEAKHQVVQAVWKMLDKQIEQMTESQKWLYDLLLYKLNLPKIKSIADSKSAAGKTQKTVLQLLEKISIEKDNLTENRLMKLLSTMSIALK